MVPTEEASRMLSLAVVPQERRRVSATAIGDPGTRQFCRVLRGTQRPPRLVRREIRSVRMIQSREGMMAGEGLRVVRGRSIQR